jgi:hypothetical protein
MTVTGPDLIALRCHGLWLVSQAAEQVSASTAPAGTPFGAGGTSVGGPSPASSA